MGERERSGKGTVRRVPVVDARGIPLMPTTPVRARRMLKEGRAVAKKEQVRHFLYSAEAQC
nr:RRXRR domain-containing protein [Methanophagales archaeon]